MQKLPDFEYAKQSKILAEFLKVVSIGDVIPYEKLSEKIDMPVQTDGYRYLYRAREILQKENRMVFDPIRNVGLKRLDDVEIVGTGVKAREKIKRSAKRAVRKIISADYDNLPRVVQVTHNMEVAILGTVAHMTTNKAIERLRPVIANDSVVLSSVQTAMLVLKDVK